MDSRRQMHVACLWVELVVSGSRSDDWFYAGKPNQISTFWFDSICLNYSAQTFAILATSQTNSRAICFQVRTSFLLKSADCLRWIQLALDGHLSRRNQFLQTCDCKKKEYFEQLHPDVICCECLSQTVKLLQLAPDTRCLRAFNCENNWIFHRIKKSSNQNKLSDDQFPLTDTSSMMFLFQFHD
jgi:hypothetical protein